METLKSLTDNQNKQEQEKPGIVRGKGSNGKYVIALVGQTETQAFSRVGGLVPGEKVFVQTKNGRSYVVSKSGKQHENTAKKNKINIKG